MKSHHVVYNISNYDFCYKPHRVDIKEIFFSLKDCPKDRAFNFAKSINYVLTFWPTDIYNIIYVHIVHCPVVLLRLFYLVLVKYSECCAIKKHKIMIDIE